MGGLQTASLPESRQLKTAESRAVAMKVMLEIPCHIPKLSACNRQQPIFMPVFQCLDNGCNQKLVGGKGGQ